MILVRGPEPDHGSDSIAAIGSHGKSSAARGIREVTEKSTYVRNLLEYMHVSERWSLIKFIIHTVEGEF